MDTTETTANITVSVAGQYCVTVSDASGCSGTACVEESSSSPDLVPDIFVKLLLRESTELNAGGGYASYAWTGGGTDQSLEVTSPGQYCVTVSDADGCTGVDCVDVEESVGTKPGYCGRLGHLLRDGNGFGRLGGFRRLRMEHDGNDGEHNGSVAGQYCVTVSDASGGHGLRRGRQIPIWFRTSRVR